MIRRYIKPSMPIFLGYPIFFQFLHKLRILLSRNTKGIAHHLLGFRPIPIHFHMRLGRVSRYLKCLTRCYLGKFHDQSGHSPIPSSTTEDIDDSTVDLITVINKLLVIGFTRGAFV